MEKLIEKIDEYNIFNFILPGLILCRNRYISRKFN